MLSFRHFWGPLLFAGVASLATAADPPLEIVVQRGPRVDAAALSGNGKFVVTAGNDLAILWESATGKRLQEFRKKGINNQPSVAISADGKLVATGDSFGQQAILWDAVTGKELRSFGGSHVQVTLSPDGKFLATGAYQVHVWETATGEKVQTFRETGRLHDVKRMAITSDGKFLVVVRASSQTAEVWNIATGVRNMKALAEHKLDLTCVAVSADGSRFATGAGDNTAVVWDMVSGKKLRTLAGSPGFPRVTGVSFESKAVTGVALSSDGKLALVGTSDGTAILWQVATGNRIQTFKDPSGSLTNVGLSDDGKSAITVSRIGPTRLWDVATGKMVQYFAGHNAIVTSLAVSGNGKTLVTGSLEGFAVAWDLGNGKLARPLPGVWSKIVAVNEKGDRAATTENGGTTVWDLTAGKKLQSYTNGSDKAMSVAISGDGRRVASGSDSAALLWQPPAAAALRFFGKEHKGTVTSVALNRDGTLLVSGSFDGTAVVWNAATGKKLQALKPPPEGGLALPIVSVALSDDGKRVVTGRFAGTAILWDATTGMQVQRFAGHDLEVKAVALSADGKRVATGAAFAVYLWDAETGQKVQTFDLANLVLPELFKIGGKARDRVLQEYGIGMVSGVAFSPDGKSLWTAAEDNIGVRLWDVATGKERCRLFCFDRGVDWLVTTPEGWFDGSPGAFRYVAFRTPGKADRIDDDATRKRFHRPGLLAKIVAGTP